jgi:hypothetical protein
MHCGMPALLRNAHVWLLALCGLFLLGAAETRPPEERYNGQSVEIKPDPATTRSHRFTPQGWPIELRLPDPGVLYLRGDKSWPQDVLDFRWIDRSIVAGSGQIYKIEGTVQPLEFDPLTVKYQPRDHLFDYTWSWLSSTLDARILSSRKGIEIRGRRWQEFRVEEPVKPHIEGREIKRGQPPLRYYLYVTPLRDGMLVLRFYYDDPPRADLPRQIALVLRYG